MSSLKAVLSKLNQVPGGLNSKAGGFTVPTNPGDSIIAAGLSKAES